MPEHLKVSSAGFNFTGKAAQWIRHRRAEGPIQSWPEFCVVVVDRFDPEGKRPSHLSAFARIS